MLTGDEIFKARYGDVVVGGASAAYFSFGKTVNRFIINIFNEAVFSERGRLRLFPHRQAATLRQG